MKTCFFPNSTAVRLAAIFLLMLTSITCTLATVRYVKPVASGTGDGSSWGNASGNLQDMINASGSGDQVWVAAGTYKPTSGTDRNISFVMKQGVAIYGGFAGGETSIAERNPDPATNNTVLSGDINTPNSNIDNSFHVIFNNNNGLNNTAVLDGFTISGGNAGSSSLIKNGGGMYNSNSSPTVTNCSFSGNFSLFNGGGMYNESSSPTVTNCSFSGNTANFGGGMSNTTNSSPTVTNCSFSGNLASTRGGGMYNEASYSTVTNCSFSGNFSATRGGGMYNEYSYSTVTNCSFSGNLASVSGGGMYNQSSSCSIVNCIFWGNSSEIFNNGSTPTITHSIVQGGCPAGATCSNVQNVDPLFVMQPDYNSAPTMAGDLHLQACSPVIDAGTATGAPTTDKDGLNRVDAIAGGGTVDIGAYEYQSDIDADDDGYSYCNDCNDEDASVHEPQLYYVDGDGDGYGSATTAMLCSSTAPSGYSTNNTDCNDEDASVHEPQLYYVDFDGDGYGSATTAMLCTSTAPSGYSTNNTDCNDEDASVHEPQLYYVDFDGDGYGSATTAMLCSSTAPSGYSTNNTDCNDEDASVHEPQLYYVDFDGDGYGSATSAMLCTSTAPSGYSTNNTDCNDEDASVHEPQLYYVDFDGDGYGSATTAMLCSSTAPSGYSTNNTDCNDNDSAVNPGATEICNNIDDNCNALIDVADPTLVDNTPPGIVCPTQPNIAVNSNCQAVIPNFTGASVSDNCSGILSVTQNPTAGTLVGLGLQTVSLTVTDASGNQNTSCNVSFNVIKTGDPGLLWAYTAIGFKEVKMKQNTVLSGGVGVVDAGKKAKLESGTMVTATNTFVKAPVLDLNGGSQVTTYHPGQVSASLLPVFQPSTGTCSNNLDIPDNSGPVTLNLACYKDIKVGKNVSVTFSGNATVNVRDLKLKEGSSVSFAQNTNLRIEKKLDSDKFVSISNGGNMVWIFVEEDVKIDDGNNFAVNIYCDKNIHIEKTPVGTPTYMTGLFIADKIDSKENVFWNWDASVCPFGTPPSLLAGILQFNAVGQAIEGKPRVDLSWVTDEDAQDDFYEVEKSLDGVTYQPVLEQNSRHNDDRTHIYQNVDPTAAEGDWLYRLKVTRKDGTTAYSEPRRVELPGDFTLFPNPAGERVNVMLKGYEGKAALLQIVNSQGVVLEQQKFDALPEEPVSFDLHNYRDGIYYLNIQVEGKRSRALKFVVAKAAGMPVPRR